MLSAEEQRRLDQIERLLQLHDPRFVARMSSGRRPRRWPALALYGALWSVVLILGLAAGWLVAGAVAAGAGLILVAVRYRRRRLLRRESRSARSRPDQKRPDQKRPDQGRHRPPIEW